LCPALIQLRVAQGIMYGSSTQSEEFSSGGEMQFASQHATTTVELSHERSSYKDRSSKASRKTFLRAYDTDWTSRPVSAVLLCEIWCILSYLGNRLSDFPNACQIVFLIIVLLPRLEYSSFHS
jgi:hypothetical protein